MDSITHYVICYNSWTPVSCSSNKYPEMAMQKALKLSSWKIITNAVHPYFLCYEQYVHYIYAEEASI